LSHAHLWEKSHPWEECNRGYKIEKGVTAKCVSCKEVASFTFLEWEAVCARQANIWQSLPKPEHAPDGSFVPNFSYSGKNAKDLVVEIEKSLDWRRRCWQILQDLEEGKIKLQSAIDDLVSEIRKMSESK